MKLTRQLAAFDAQLKKLTALIEFLTGPEKLAEFDEGFAPKSPLDRSALKAMGSSPVEEASAAPDAKGSRGGRRRGGGPSEPEAGSESAQGTGASGSA